ncbi:ABC transporter substrate-binding protein [Jiangella sp. DSM 45060]|uniref:ABC transporter substrate-binding protein n=1 Tax=Jiangella sp. DSM 45060 TaxID=1798224 RepID=UPI00087A9F7B|nr:ABC transporter substrate-binding protein [Jiangella sp. DSM 45060]SDT16437.1 peptide/nickel transport system substrate-binding protein [Jiangella sp. DSM 45060]
MVTRPVSGHGPRRRSARGLAAVAGLVAVLLTACQNNTGPDTGSAGTDGGEPVSGGTLVLGIQSDPSPLNPNLTTNGPTQQIGTMIYEPLVYFDNEAAEPKPVLAESWEISDDGLTYTFHLVDATFTNGDPLTSTDVKYTIEQVSTPMFAPFAQAASVIESIDDSDPKTVVIQLKEPFGPLLLSLTRVWILPASVFQGSDPATNPASIDQPVGTGPFMLDEVSRGSQWTLTRNPEYWQEDRPYLDSIVARVVPDAQSATLALAAGEIQYISSQVISPTDVEAVVQRNQAVAHPDSFAPNMTQVFFNTTRDITGDPAVRHALAMAIDREFLLENVFQGGGEVARAPFDSRLEWAYNDEVDFDELYPYDPEAAAQALDDAGYPMQGDSRFSLTILAEGASRFQEVAEAIRSMLLEVGIDAQVSAPEASVATEQAFTAPGDFDLYIQSYTTNWDPALGIARAYVSTSIGTPFGNASGYSDPEVDELFAAGRSGTTEDQRAEPYRQVQEILAEDLPVMPLIETKLNDAHAPNVNGVWYAANWGQWQEAWVG